MMVRGEVNHWGDGTFYRERVPRGVLLLVVLLLSFTAFAQLGPGDVLILVNANSPTSRYIAKMYRGYYPQIADVQVLELPGLTDCSGPASTAADEIITRDQYNTLIAAPLRNHLIAYDLASAIKVIITTAGLPYRIEDAVYPNVIYPAGSNYNDVSIHVSEINAASVESELTCLWFCDYGTYPTNSSNRIVNPYQGYRGSSITCFERLLPNTKPLTWNTAITSTEPAPKMEGQMKFMWPPSYGTTDRKLSAGDLYLTCRLDGPKMKGESAVFAVRNMLERSRRASNPACGVNPAQGVIILDDSPNKSLDQNRVYNLNGSMNYYVYNSTTKQPPDAITVLTMDDYTAAFYALTNGTVTYPTGMNAAMMSAGYNLKVMLDRRNAKRTCQTDLAAEDKTVFLCGFGRNGDEGGTTEYLTTGLNGGPLFNPANGAVFTSIESFSAVTLFSDEATAPVAQGKIINFMEIGGTAAIGHTFEPMSTAAVDTVFLAYNLFADNDGDGIADLTFIEAAFTAIPFLSWTEVVLGDPLMRIAYGPGESTAWSPSNGDCNADGTVNVRDVRVYSNSVGGNLNSTDPQYFQIYNDLADFNCDGVINVRDLRILQKSLY
jgi:hypothetical protein